MTTLAHIDFLLPIPAEKIYFLDWLACLVQNPGIRLAMLLMVTPQFGVGRGTLNKIIRKMFGALAGSLSFNQLCGATPYNDWGVGKLLLLIDETKEIGGIKSEQASRIQAYEHIKDNVDTEPMLGERINPKYGKQYEDDLYFNVLANSNHLDAVMIPQGDRRVAVLSNPKQKHPDGDSYYANLVEVLGTDEEAQKLWSYLSTRKISGDFRPGWPLYTPAKQRMEEASISPSEQLFYDAVDRFPGDIATLEQFTKMLSDLVSDPANIYGGRVDDYAKHAKDKFKNLDTIEDDRDNKLRLLPGGNQVRSRIIRNSDQWENQWPVKKDLIRAEVLKNEGI